MEQRAAEAEREAVKLKKAEYMLEHVGEEYDGVISGVTGWGFYVELPNTVEGLVHIMTLKDDYYNFDEEIIVWSESSTEEYSALVSRCVSVSETPSLPTGQSILRM